MQKFIVDTNCLISYLTDRDLKQQVRISPYFAKTNTSEAELIIPEVVIFEFVYVLTEIYQIDVKFIKSLLEKLSESPNISPQSVAGMAFATKLWPSRIRDYGDAVIGELSAKLDLPVLTFDKVMATQFRKSGLRVTLL